ncbi:Hypothetical predicted protein [Mytilus galloprovincialis]|uniref:Uncharacterized protein n=1 Tax=Mytilus galloprovincialis TaxID=29158 RepID=A0A8B6HM91_MYTGA|nr:Hypothetical predicted protein [Mytilus galloprovincialis]
MAQARKDAKILKEKYIAEDINIEQERRKTLKERIDEKEAKLKKSEQHLEDKNMINLMKEENKITNIEDAIVPIEVDEDIYLSCIASNDDNPLSPFPPSSLCSSTIILNLDQSPSIPEPSTANNSQSPTSSSVSKHNQSASASVPTQLD